MNAMPMKPTSDAGSTWRGQISHGDSGLSIIVDGVRWRRLTCPPLASLKRRFDASDKGWIDAWMSDTIDPTEPASDAGATEAER